MLYKGIFIQKRSADTSKAGGIYYVLLYKVAASHPGFSLAEPFFSFPGRANVKLVASWITYRRR